MSRVTLSDTSRLRVPDDVLFEDLEGETILLNLASGIYFGLDPVGTRAWQLIEVHGRLGPVKEAMLAEYEVSDACVGEDLRNLVIKLVEKGLLEVVDESEPVA